MRFISSSKLIRAIFLSGLMLLPYSTWAKNATAKVVLTGTVEAPTCTPTWSNSVFNIEHGVIGIDSATGKGGVFSTHSLSMGLAECTGRKVTAVFQGDPDLDDGDAFRNQAVSQPASGVGIKLYHSSKVVVPKSQLELAVDANKQANLELEVQMVQTADALTKGDVLATVVVDFSYD